MSIKTLFKSALKRIFNGERKEESLPVIASPSTLANDPAVETEAAVSMTIWTIERNRYADARALCTEIEVYPSGAHELCEDIFGYVLDTPNGESVVVEARTGSLVGHSLELVRDGVREMTHSQLNAQLDTARKEFNRMNKIELSNEEFWKAIRMGESEVEIVQEFQE